MRALRSRAARSVALEVIRAVEGTRGSFVSKNGHNDPDDDGCPHCGCRCYVAFIDDEWDGNQSSPDDAFECFACGATFTRRDAFGHEGRWDKDAVVEQRAEMN